jgi:hypothetical protein
MFMFSEYCYTDFSLPFVWNTFLGCFLFKGFNFRDGFFKIYKGISKSFWTELITKSTTLIEKQHKGLWCQNSLDWPQNSNTVATSGRELYHLQFSIQAASPESFGYTLVSMLLVVFSFCLYWFNCLLLSLLILLYFMWWLHYVFLILNWWGEF